MTKILENIKRVTNHAQVLQFNAFELNGEQVPEPTTAGIFALAGLGFVARRRRA